MTTLEVLERNCSAGYWCSAGKPIECVRNTFNELTNADDQSYCLPCPENSVSPVGSASFDACVCASGFFADTRILPMLQRLRAANLTKSDAFRRNA